MALLGFLLIIWGITDYVMDQNGTDVYYDWLGIYLPDNIYTYSPWIAMTLGGLMIGAAQRKKSLFYKEISTFEMERIT